MIKMKPVSRQRMSNGSRGSMKKPQGLECDTHGKVYSSVRHNCREGWLIVSEIKIQRMFPGLCIFLLSVTHGDPILT
jgi:hypothetical protein